MYINRALEVPLKKAIKVFPAVVITGPRQSGKTTLLKKIWGKSHRFVSLEDPDIRLIAENDPRAFLDRFPPPVIIDEIQYVPSLLSYAKTMIDNDRKPGNWLFTGSQNYVLMQEISQSLAGRVAVLSLMPFDYSEIRRFRKKILLNKWLLTGGYPEPNLKKGMDKSLWVTSYIATYLERDMKMILNVSDVTLFHQFLKMCALRTGQQLNLQNLSRDIGVSVPTVKRWISVLLTSYQIILVYPYYNNPGKRLVKSPKLYFIDTGIATRLMGIKDKDTLLGSSSFGALYETGIIVDIWKQFLHQGCEPPVYYLKTRDGLEVDILIEEKNKLNLFELKSTATPTPKHAAHLKHWHRIFRARIGRMGVVTQSKISLPLAENIPSLPWTQFLESGAKFYGKNF